MNKCVALPIHTMRLSSLFIVFFQTCILIYCTHKPSYSQTFTLLKEVKISTPVAFSTDRYTNILIGDNKGNVYKFDSTGNNTHTYSPPHNAAISSVDAWQTLHMLIFYKDTQMLTLTNRFLVPLPGYPTQLNNQQIGFARAAAIAADESIWLFDEVDFSLKKLNLRSQAISLHTPLELILDISEYQINFMREYQNMLYINDKNSGILVFDNLGNYKKKLPFPQLDFFSFYNNEIYFFRHGKIHFFNLYTLAEREMSLPIREPLKFIIFSDKLLFLATEKSLLIYKFF